MPEDISPPQLESVNLDDREFTFGAQSLEDAAALAMVVRTFRDYENYRRQNHDTRWNGNDALYCAYLPTKTWEGSRIPRASHSQPVCFAQIETALPIIEQNIFGSEEDWFQVEPEPGGDPNEARAIKDHLTYLLEHDKDDYGCTARREIDMAAKSILMYGNGGIAVFYDVEKKRPCVEWVDIRDIYIDPGVTTPSVDDCRAVIRRMFYTVEELDAMRGNPGMNVPPKGMLYHFAQRPISAAGDQTKTIQEAFRGVNYVPGSSDHAAVPSDRKVEVLRYYTNKRIIWVIGRQWILFNGPNPYGFTPFCFAPCFTFLGRFYGLGYPDVLEGSQRYAESLFNKRLDELSLSLNPPKIKKPGALMTPSQERYFPGATFQVGDPKNDLAFDKPQGATANIMGDIGFILEGADKITGVNGPLGGNFQAGNVNRTKGGVDAQVSGASSRLYYIIKNIEDYLIVPMLYKMYKLIQFHTEVNDLLPALGQNDQLIQIGAKAFQDPMRFRMVAASRMMSREKLAGMLPFISQYFLNGQLLTQLHSAGKTVDFDNFMSLIQDATGTGRQYQLIRPLTQQEQQALNAPPPQVQAQQQQSQQELQTRVQIASEKNQTALQIEQMKHQPDPQEQQKKAMEMALEARQKQQEMQAAQAQQQQQFLHDAVQSHLDRVRAEADARQSAQHRNAETQQKLHHAAQLHQQKLSHQEQQNAEKIRLARVLAALKQEEAMTPPAQSPQQ